MQDDRRRNSGQPLSMPALRRALSEERFDAYSLPEDRDALDGVARYVWNIALASALTPSLHAVEVTLRNNLFGASRRVVDKSGMRFSEVPCWLDANPTLLYAAEADAVASSKSILRRMRKPMTPGQLVASLPFGFWVSLLRSPYEQGRPNGPGLWPAALQYAFPFLPKAHRTRSAVRERLEEIRDLRNRAFHHEPIWNRDIARYQRRLLEALGWMNPGMSAAIRQASGHEVVYERGALGYREVAEALVHV